MMEGELRENMKNFLLNQELCPMCVQRYLGERQQQNYCRLVGDWQSPGEPRRKRIQRSVCPACLGILEASFLFDTFDAVLDTVSNSSCVFDNFLMSIAVPPVTLLRHRHVYLLMKEKFENVPAESELATVKDCVKYVVGNLFEESTKKLYSPTASFQISIQITGDLEPSEKSAMSLLHKPASQRFKKAKKAEEFSIKSITSFLEEVSREDFLLQFKELPKSVSALAETPVIRCGHQQIYFAGRYCKFSRELSQTPWIIDGERKMKDSVEELIVEIFRKTVLCERVTFSSSGREDVDVRMLGEGRPFILEVWSPKRINWTHQEMRTVQDAINASTKEISVNRLQLISRDSIKDLKIGEEDKRKFYVAYCVSREKTNELDFSPLKSLNDLVLKQRTPLRVLHRRTVMTRDRTIHEASVEIQDDHHFKLSVTTQAGTYVKEFVHGDFGRTLPNVRKIMNADVDIEALDVVKIDLDWPPEVPDGIIV